MTLYPDLLEDVLKVDGLDVRYYDNATADNAPPIVLVHGTGGPAENNFWALYPMLAFNRRVITFDFALPEEELTLDHYVRQTAAVIRTVSAEGPVALVGYSLGAVVAAATAARYPELVDSLVLTAGWMRTDRQQLLRNDIWQDLKREQSDAITNFTLFSNYSGHHLVTRSGPEYDELLERSRRVSYEPQIMALNRTIDIADEIESITAPTLVVGCTLDIVAPIRHSRELFGGIADARYVEIHSGHAVVHERPAELFARIDSFLLDPEAIKAGTILPTLHA
ncbi:UNVERIFIED_ORG: pimeloyl-ACP methyl ester carboxylesterase [Paenarthrobacter nicotinovorans]